MLHSKVNKLNYKEHFQILLIISSFLRFSRRSHERLFTLVNNPLKCKNLSEKSKHINKRLRRLFALQNLYNEFKHNHSNFNRDLFWSNIFIFIVNLLFVLGKVLLTLMVSFFIEFIIENAQQNQKQGTDIDRPCKVYTEISNLFAVWKYSEYFKFKYFSIIILQNQTFMVF